MYETSRTSVFVEVQSRPGLHVRCGLRRLDTSVVNARCLWPYPEKAMTPEPCDEIEIPDVAEHIRSARDRAAEICALPADWDGPDGTPIDPKSANNAVVLVAHATCPDCLGPTLSPTSAGNILVDWTWGSDDVEVEVFPDGRLDVLVHVSGVQWKGRPEHRQPRASRLARSPGHGCRARAVRPSRCVRVNVEDGDVLYRRVRWIKRVVDNRSVESLVPGDGGDALVAFDVQELRRHGFDVAASPTADEPARAHVTGDKSRRSTRRLLADLARWAITPE